MVFVPPDRTVRRERLSRAGAAACLVAAVVVCLAITAFGGDDGAPRIAVAYRSPAATASSHPPRVAAAPALPPRTYATLRAQLPVPTTATHLGKAGVPSWQVRTSLASVKRFYLRELAALGLRWHPLVVRAGPRVAGWSGTVDTDKADVIARLTLRAPKHGPVSIGLHR